MAGKFRGRVSSAHVIAVLALFVALGGSAYAGIKIGTKQIKNSAVTTKKIKKRAVTTAKIRNNSVTTAKIRNNSVTAAKLPEYSNSGLVKLMNGRNRVLLQRGPFRFVARCVDAGGGGSTASLLVKNTGSASVLFESEEESNYENPLLPSGQTLNAFEPATDNTPYWFGTYYNMFSATSANGRTSLYGGGNIGVKVLGADCVFQLFTQGR